MPKKITAWQCAYCSRYRINKRSITRHEEICFRNPERKILQGEMAIWKTLPRELMQHNSYGVDGSDFVEPYWDAPESLLQKYRWWPRDEEDGGLGLGLIFIAGSWARMEGYEPPNFAPGYSWRDEVVPERYYEMSWKLRQGISLDSDKHEEKEDDLW